MSVLRGAWAPAAVTALGAARFGVGVLVAGVLVAVLVGMLMGGRAVVLRQTAVRTPGRHRARS